MKTIIGILLISFLFIGTSAYFKETKISTTDTSFYAKHFYLGLVLEKDLNAGIKKTGELGEYLQGIFWLSFVLSAILFSINLGISISECKSDDVKFLGFIIIIFIHLIYWGLLFSLGIFLANLGSGWFVGGGGLSFFVFGFGMNSMNEHHFIPFSKTISRFFDRRRRYNLIYNNIKNQEIIK